VVRRPGVIALLAGASLLGAILLAWHATTPTASAQAQPPNRYYGSVSINGQDQSEGTVVEAYIGNTLCGSGTVQSRNGATIYLVDVLGAGQKSGCANDGDKVTFKVAGLDAKETGTYTTAAATRLDLSASGNARNPAQQPTVLAPGAGGTPAPPPSLPTSEVGISTPPPPAFTGTPEEGSARPAAEATETPGPEATATATETATATATASATATSAAAATRSSGNGKPALVVVAILVVLAIAVAAAASIYRRRPNP
jgi:hypothetical protein